MNKTMPKLIIALALATTTTTSLLAGIPKITKIGAEENVGSVGRLVDIATDSQSQPHIIADVGGSNRSYFYDKIGSRWLTPYYFDSGGQSGQSYNPHIEINKRNQAWYSVVKWYSQGMGLMFRNNMATSPTKVIKYTSTTGGAGGLPVSNLGIDPDSYNRCVAYGGNGGWYDKVVWNGSSFASEGIGSLGVLKGGEKNYFYISRAGNFAHRGGLNQPVWHGCTDGSYNNSVRKQAGKGPVNWVDWGHYIAYTGNDGCYPMVVGDSVEPQTAYFFTDYKQYGGPGVMMNVWKGSGTGGDGHFVFNGSNLLNVDPNGTSGLRRYEPQMCPDNNGGVWVCYTAGSNIRIRYIPSDIKSAADMGPITQFSGARGTICMDKDGNLHVAYIKGGVKYRKLTVSGSRSGVTYLSNPADFDGDGHHDLCVVTEDGYWYYRKSSTGDEMRKKWGISGDVPVPGKYENKSLESDQLAVWGSETGESDQLAVWRPETGMWISRNDDGKTKTEYKLGKSGDIPVPADYDGDGQTDYAVFTPTSGVWKIHTSTATNRTVTFGNEGDVPFAFDAFNPDTGASYDTDSVPDLVVWSPEKNEWHIKCSDGGAVFVNGWGGDGDRPIPGDYDGDGEVDFAVFRPSTQKWYIKKSNDGSQVIRKWGIEGDVPCPGDYDQGDHKWDYAVYRNGRFHVNKSSDGTKIGEAPVWLGGHNDTPVPGNYDNTTDVAVASYNPKTGWWYTGYTNGTASVDKWGIPGDKAVPADYDGDGIMDRAVFRDGWWYIDHSSGGKTSQKWGVKGDIPVPGDYVGNGMIDYAVFRNGYWHVSAYDARVGGRVHLRSKFGVKGDLPYPGYYDNDNIIDMGVYRPSTGFWYMKGSASNTTMRVKCGVPSRKDKPIPADYDGDALTDPAVFVASKKEIVYASSITGYTTYGRVSVGTGDSRDIPVVADYDGDGILDPGVLNGKNFGQWYINLSATKTLMEDPRVGVSLSGNGAPLGGR